MLADQGSQGCFERETLMRLAGAAGRQSAWNGKEIKSRRDRDVGADREVSQCQAGDRGADGGAAGPGTGGAAPTDAEMALRRMGKEPKLNNKADVAGTPEAPQPVVVNQATTQDLEKVSLGVGSSEK